MIEIYTDGSCDNKKGDGGWGWVAVRRAEGVSAANGPGGANYHPGDAIVAEDSGGFPPGSGRTNNYMELQAIYNALNWLIVTRPEIVQANGGGHKSVPLWTDSTYARKCLTEYIPKWKARGWTTSIGTPVANRTLLLYITRRLKQCHALGYGVRIRHIKGHRYFYNEHADNLAGAARIAAALES
jgi:ribonuclease HI